MVGLVSLGPPYSSPIWIDAHQIAHLRTRKTRDPQGSISRGALLAPGLAERCRSKSKSSTDFHASPPSAKVAVCRCAELLRITNTFSSP